MESHRAVCDGDPVDGAAEGSELTLELSDKGPERADPARAHGFHDVGELLLAQDRRCHGDPRDRHGRPLWASMRSRTRSELRVSSKPRKVRTKRARTMGSIRKSLRDARGRSSNT